MTKDDLCRLALAAIDDADARPVLADALEETGWWDERIDEVGASFWVGTTHPAVLLMNLHDRWESPAVAVAVVLLLGDWPTSWPLAERCLQGDAFHVMRAAGHQLDALADILFGIQRGVFVDASSDAPYGTSGRAIEPETDAELRSRCLDTIRSYGP